MKKNIKGKALFLPEKVHVYIKATFSNTIITVTNTLGDKLVSRSAGEAGYKGTKKGSPFAAQKASDILSKIMKEAGAIECEVYISGPGKGSNTAIKAMAGNGIKVRSITYITKFPFNGVRASKKRKV